MISNPKLKSLFQYFHKDFFHTLTLSEQKQLIKDTIDEVIKEKGLEEIPVVFQDTPDMGGFHSSYNNIISINLSDLSPNNPTGTYWLLGTIFHETRHYEQEECGNEKMQESLKVPFGIQNKYYIHQLHEKDAYEYSLRELKKVNKELNLPGLDEYIKAERQRLNRAYLNLSPLEYLDIKKKIQTIKDETAPVSNIYKKYFSDFYPEHYAFNYDYVTVSRNNQGNIVATTISAQETQDFAYMRIYEPDYTSGKSPEDIRMNNSVILSIKDNKAIIMIEAYMPPSDNIEALIDTAQTMVHKYNQANNRNISEISLVTESPNVHDYYLQEIFNALPLKSTTGPVIKVDNKPNQVLINGIDMHIRNTYSTSLLNPADGKSCIDENIFSLDLLNELLRKEMPGYEIGISNRHEVMNQLKNYIEANDTKDQSLIEMLIRSGLAIKVHKGPTLDLDAEIAANTSNEEKIQGKIFDTPER